MNLYKNVYLYNFKMTLSEKVFFTDWPIKM